jgi:hypothetical protein
MNKYMVSAVVILITTLFIVFSALNKDLPVKNIQSGGVVVDWVDGIRYNSPGFITNTNNFPVMIRCVWQNKGEKTEWVERLNPGQSKALKNVDIQHAFYIYKKELLLGFINID